jgi:hypothetical protein
MRIKITLILIDGSKKIFLFEDITPLNTIRYQGETYRLHSVEDIIDDNRLLKSPIIHRSYLFKHQSFDEN